MLPIDLVDVSDNDGIIQVHPLQSAGMTFLGIKLSEGATYTDPDAHIYGEKADAIGAMKILYHLLRDSAAPLQVENYLKMAKGAGRFVPCLDYEDLSKTTDERAHEFLSLLVSKLGPNVLKYMPIEYLYRMGFVTSEELLWVPEYDESLSAPHIGHWTFWQYSEFGSIAGVTGTHLDLSTFNKGKGDKVAWFNANAVTY